MSEANAQLYNRKKMLTWSGLKSGLIVTIGLAILLVVILFSGISRMLFVPQKTLQAQFGNASGLRKGSPVWLLGVEVGTVRDIRFSDTSTIATLSIRKKAFDHIYANARPSIMNMGLLGDKYVELHPGDISAGKVSPDAMLHGEAEGTFDEILRTSTTSIQKVQEFITQINSIIALIDTGGGSLAKFIRSPEFYEEVYGSINTFSALLKELQRSNGTMRKLINDPSLYDTLLAATRAVKQFSHEMGDTGGTAYRLLNDTSLYADARKGIARVSDLLDSAQSGKGVLGQLSANDSLVLDMQGAIRRMNILLDDIRENPDKYFSFELF
ncbi:MAG: MCE family protein [Chitinivibrionales bacterium]|nr:MCE family protein [Chitinivibrionales bacterium]